ncbi:MAG: hypothetical protein ACYST0_09965 [Planctomycetota bacterium]|jgi:hypothetical protein
MNLSHSFVFTALLVVPGLDAQAPKYLYSPAGSEKEGGGLAGFVANWPPWQSGSATYQQIHDYAEMVRVAGGKPVAITMKGLGFRPVGKTQLLGRTWELRLSMGHSPNSSVKISATFTNNLTNARVVYGTSTTFSKFSFTTVTGTGDPNPIGFTVPFATTYVYLPIKNNHFCWEWRHRNASTLAPMVCDFVSGQYGPGTRLPSIGNGCNAWSDIGLPTSLGRRLYVSTLSGASANTRAMAMLGLTKQQTRLPGWCSNLETIPVLHVFGKTNGAGSMSFSSPTTVLRGVPQFTLYVQYAFADSRQPFGVGLSNMSAYRTNLPGGWNIGRVFSAGFNSNVNTHATATKGVVETVYGLVVGFQQ